MALTQSAQLPGHGPLWDEEVVPALRKRLESESRTLARRISAISISSGDEAVTPNHGERNTYQKQSPLQSTSVQQSYSSSSRKSESSHQYTSDQTTSVSPPRPNGTSAKASKSATPASYQRSRTYSSPHGSNFSKPQPNGVVRPKLNGTKTDPPRPALPRTSADIKPTRIPKVARPPTSGSTSGPSNANGYGSHGAAVTSSHSPELPYRQGSLDHPAPNLRHNNILLPPTTASSSRSTIDLPRGSSTRHGPSGLLNETPPFPTDATMPSGLSQQGRSYEHQLEEDLPRPSIESEERPYEHWYRGEVSRNGGVGELRVGRRQEMLDIANYGHLIGNKKPPTNRLPPGNYVEDLAYQRKRADSIGGLTNKERTRGSVYLDDEHANRIDHILDENPLTDLEDEETDSQSVLTDQFDENDVVSVGAYAYVPSVDDVHSIASSAEQWTTVAGAHEARSTTPTPLGRPSSRQTQNLPPTRIPGPSSRRSSESRSTVNTTSIPAPIIRGASEPPQAHSSSSTPSPPPVAQSSTTPAQNQRAQLGVAANNLAAPAKQKRTVSPASKKGRTPVKSKAKPVQKKDDRKSVAQYPTVEGDELADAIPSWTQPTSREGNWDEVVLPVVARKKGLDRHYEDADGSPQPKKPTDKPVEPAPGTFGFNHSKYRQPQLNDEFIPMDEFGRPAEEDERLSKSEDTVTTPTTLAPDVSFPTRPAASPSPAPFAHYAPTSFKVVEPSITPAQHQQDVEDIQEQEEKGAGCCKCVVM
ncbi:hypothetical protein CPB83DRAFT_871954 [Crepidotus variabilis]|uniref:Uncharacterized protein n=1 Tax=Crepidotus variabilis TaxID=179855 RepID=A0A9P6E4V7_9AGAR|nr:hypothetical protein CPB83DRAFT_871954 [Crepidotus variabilis]